MANIQWYGDTVIKNILAQAQGIIDELGAEILAEAEPPQDTSFLKSSAYINSASGLNTFDDSPPSGDYLSRRTNEEEKRERAPQPVEPPRNGAVIGWSAVYAGDVEERTPFGYPAVLRVASKRK